MPHISTAVSVRPDALPAPIGCWQPLRLLRRSPYADVFLARPVGATARGADYLLKALRDDCRDHPEAQELLANEVAAGRSVSHPHLVPVLDANLRRVPCHLVMPRLEGVRLDRLSHEQQCPARRALRSARQMAEGLAALHEAGWRHGDVKPANAIVSPLGHTSLIDLGMACRLPCDDAPLTAWGTPCYTAPEALRQPGDSRSDIYSLGASLFELLAGHPPFTSNDPSALAAAHQHQTPPRLEETEAVAPRGAGALLRRMLAKDPDDRPTARQTVDELVPLEVAALGWL